MNTISINGVTVSVPDSASISVEDGVIYIDGSPWTGNKEKDVTIKVEGGLINLTVDRGSVEVTGTVNGNVKAGNNVKISGNVGQSVHASSSVSCGDVNGPVTAGSGVQCNNVTGDVKAGSSVKCGEVGGNVKAGSSVRYGNK